MPVKQLQASPDAGNALEWRANGFYLPPGATEAEHVFGTAIRRQEFMPATGATQVVLSSEPVTVLSVSRNGVEQNESAGNYTIDAEVITFVDDIAPGERVSVVYTTNVPDPTALIKREEFVPTVGATSITLEEDPVMVLSVTRNGVEQSEGYYSVVGDLITFTDDFTGSERVTVLYNMGSGLTRVIGDFDPDLYYTKLQADARFAPIVHTHTGYVAKTGDTMTGSLSISNPSAESTLLINSPTGNANLLFQTAGSHRQGIFANQYYVIGHDYQRGDTWLVYYNGNAVPGSGYLSINPNGSTTFVGSLAVSSGEVSATIQHRAPLFVAQGPVGTNRGLSIYTSGTMRWFLAASDVAETGLNAGSDLYFYRYNDVGGYLGVPFSINRATGNAAFSGQVTVPTLIVASNPVVVSPTADNALTWDATGLYVPVVLPGEGGGTTILNGPGSPSLGTGVDGNYYLDTAADTLYGPKGVAQLSGPEYAVATQAVTHDAYGNFHLGVKFRSTVSGALIKVKLAVNPSNTVGMRDGWRIQLWSIDGNRLQRYDLSVPSTGGSFADIDLPTPWPITPNTTYVVTVWVPVGSYRSYCGSWTGGSSGPLTMLAPNADGPNGLYGEAGPDLLPTGNWNGYVPALWPVFQAGDTSQAWPVAVASGMSQATADARYVDLVGDTMTGPLTIPSYLQLSPSASTNWLLFRQTPGYESRILFETDAALGRWSIVKTNEAESGLSAGSNLEVWRYNDAGTWQGAALKIARATGVVDFATHPTVSGAQLRPWVQMTQAAYDALTPPDPNTLYVIVG
jgi:hypothetical protein